MQQFPFLCRSRRASARRVIRAADRFAARLACTVVLLLFFVFGVCAASVKVDGKVYVIAEYNDTLNVLQLPRNESNNNLSYAYLHWRCSPADYSVYLGLQYYCTDHAIEDGLTGVEVRINDELCCVVYADGTIETDWDRYTIESAFVVGESDPYEVTCEVRVGIKFWPEGEITAGIRILDFSGGASNYYRQLVYSPYTTTTKAEKTTKPEKTTAAKTTAAQTTTARGKDDAVRRTTRPVITAAPKRETTEAATQARTTQTKPQTTAEMRTTKAAKVEKTTKTAKSKTRAAATTRATTAAPPVPAAAVRQDTTTAQSTETTTAPQTIGSVNAQVYHTFNSVKLVGTVLVTALLTAAALSSVFLGLRRKEETPEAQTPQEEYDDFG